MTAEQLYLDLMKRLLTRDGIELADDWRDLESHTWTRIALEPTKRLIGRRGYRLVGRSAQRGETMIGRERLDVVQMACEAAIGDQVPGDFLEAGVWRGGTTIFMRAVLAAHEITDRTVWVADTFAGVPLPSPGVTADEGLDFHEHALAVSREQVQSYFIRYGLLDSQVRFLEGLFAETLPEAPIESLAVLRLDGDLYQSTWDSIVNLYPKMQSGGFVLVDDYGSIEATRRAVDDYRAERLIGEPINEVAGSGWWRVGAL